MTQDQIAEVDDDNFPKRHTIITKLCQVNTKNYGPNRRLLSAILDEDESTDGQNNNIAPKGGIVKFRIAKKYIKKKSSSDIDENDIINLGDNERINDNNEIEIINYCDSTPTNFLSTDILFTQRAPKKTGSNINDSNQFNKMNMKSNPFKAITKLLEKQLLNQKKDSTKIYKMPLPKKCKPISFNQLNNMSKNENANKISRTKYYNKNTHTNNTLYSSTANTISSEGKNLSKFLTFNTEAN